MAQDGAEESDERRPTVGDLVIRWGLIAGGIAAIIGLGVLVWDLLHPDPPTKLDARFEQVAIESGVTFGDFKGQLMVAANGVPELALAALQVDETATPATTGSPTTTVTETATATSSASVSPTATGTATIDPAARGVQVQRSEEPGEIILTPSNAARGRPSAVALPSGCQFTEERATIVCDGQLSLTWATHSRSAQPDEEEAVVSARRFIRVLRDTRLRTIVRHGKRFTEPLGIAVTIEAVIEGYRGKRVDVHWSLHRAGSGRPSPRAWLADRRVLRRTLEANSQRISADFWVPLPRSHARSFIRVGIYDQQRRRVTYKDTKRFK
jgi:hypothetical protein